MKPIWNGRPQCRYLIVRRDAVPPASMQNAHGGPPLHCHSAIRESKGFECVRIRQALQSQAHSLKAFNLGRDVIASHRIVGRRDAVNFGLSLIYPFLVRFK